MNTRQRDRPAQGSLPVHGVRDRSGRRAAARPEDRRDRDDLAQPGAAGGAVAFDAAYWTPWGTFITAEESWADQRRRAPPSPYGRLFELKNPLDGAWHRRPAHGRQQRRRRLRAPERHSAHLARGHPVRRRRQHVLHRRAERRQRLQVRLAGQAVQREARQGRLLRGRPDLRAARGRRQHAERHGPYSLGPLHGRERRRRCRARSPSRTRTA